MSRLSRPLFRLALAAALALLPLRLDAAPAENSAAGWTPPALKFRAPAGFTAVEEDSELFRRSAEQAVTHGRLLRLYVPQDMARRLKEGRPDAVTRQVLVCALEGQERPLDQSDAELLSRSLEGLFIGFSQLPSTRELGAAEAQQLRRDALREACEQGRPMLVDSVRTPTAYLHTFLLHHAAEEKKRIMHITSAMAAAAVPLNDTVLFLTVSSLTGQEDAGPHLDWAKESASAFADMLVQANKPGKKK